MKSVILELVGIKTFTSPLIHNIIMHKGETIRLDEVTAGKIAGLKRESLNDSVVIHYFKEHKEEGQDVSYDLTSVASRTAINDGASPEQLTAASKVADAPAKVLEEATEVADPRKPNLSDDPDFDPDNPPLDDPEKSGAESAAAAPATAPAAKRATPQRARTKG